MQFLITKIQQVIKFLKYITAVIVGSITTVFILFLMFIIIAMAFSYKTTKSNETFKVTENSIYYLTLNNPIVERAPLTPFEDFPIISQYQEKRTGLNDILENIKKAADEPNIKGIFLDITYIQAGIATISDIRQELQKFKESGKFIIAYGDFYEKKAYYLASVADSVFLNPLGALEFTGLKSEINYLKNSFDKLGVKAEVIKAGKFKSFGERFVNEKISNENTSQIYAYINSVWRMMLNDIEKNRKIPADTLHAIASRLDTDTPEKILKNNLIDNLLHKDEVISIIKAKCGLTDDDKIKLVSHKQMTKANNKNITHDTKVAVVYAWGDVIMGTGEEGNISDKRISKALKSAREDSSVKAVVLRVNSGGGSSLASEKIWREIYLTQKEKPLIASFGDVAASGGYYIALPADTILANKYTLTGSIGVFGMLFNGEDLLQKKLAINNEVVKTTPYADIGNVYRKMLPAERKSIQNMVDAIYSGFVNHVAEARKSDYESIDNVAQGRIWIASDAKEHNLIDDYGNLSDAINTAARMADLTEYNTIDLPKLVPDINSLFNDLPTQIKQHELKKSLGGLYLDYQRLDHSLSMDKYQTRIPYELEIN